MNTVKQLNLDTAIEDEENHLELENEAWAAEHKKPLMDREKHLTDAAELIAHNSIKEKTRFGHLRIIGAFVKFMLEQDPKWTASMTRNSPYDVHLFITKKCASPSEGGEGKKFPTAVSIQAALTYFYKSLRSDESVSEW
ncbi:hypothetical protein M422DRAFT_248397 [Sphaerobolus stellatus SS14]|uniref:Uncharacterized protein n=1 Tax=Sphaerobolus stellatus (strain SS14) TaxID=990650 RepID=A0A0C9UVY4_SPHS4|nr:hypothetical protein M422DRAFT_248397 [Sphaerobolus stellatus SS14]